MATTMRKRLATPESKRRKATREKTKRVKCEHCNGKGYWLEGASLSVAECEALAKAVDSCSEDTRLFLDAVRRDGFAKTYRRVMADDEDAIVAASTFLGAIDQMFHDASDRGWTRKLGMNDERGCVADRDGDEFLKDYPPERFTSIARLYLKAKGGEA